MNRFVSRLAFVSAASALGLMVAACGPSNPEPATPPPPPAAEPAQPEPKAIELGSDGAQAPPIAPAGTDPAQSGTTGPATPAGGTDTPLSGTTGPAKTSGVPAGAVPGGKAMSCAPTACKGPKPQMLAKCPDGSEAGATGRCVRVEGQCVWEVRSCP